MYGWFDPIVVYGLLETDDSKVISANFLERYHVERFPTELIQMHACNFVYGVRASLDQVRLNHVLKDDEDVIAKFVEALEKKGVNLDELDVFLAIWNNEYENDMTEYLDDTMMAMTTTTTTNNESTKLVCHVGGARVVRRTCENSRRSG